MNAHAEAEAGFSYLVEVVKNGEVIETEICHNLLPIEGANHMVGVVFKGQSAVSQWYVGLFEGNFTPSVNDVAATLPSLATECASYSGATRVAFTPGAVAAGAVDNTAARAEFTFTAAKTVYGGFISSAPAKGATTGVLASLVRFSSPKTLDADSILRVTAGFTLSSI